MKRALLFVAIAALWSGTRLFAATITLTPRDPRIDNPNLIDRDWGVRLRNFRNRDGSKIYIGSGDLSFAGNRNVADMTWNDTGLNPFTLTYAPSPPRITMTAAGLTSASKFYNFQTPVANPNQSFNTLLIQLAAVMSFHSTTWHRTSRLSRRVRI